MERSSTRLICKVQGTHACATVRFGALDGKAITEFAQHRIDVERMQAHTLWQSEGRHDLKSLSSSRIGRAGKRRSWERLNYSRDWPATGTGKSDAPAVTRNMPIEPCISQSQALRSGRSGERHSPVGSRMNSGWSSSTFTTSAHSARRCILSDPRESMVQRGRPTGQ